MTETGAISVGCWLALPSPEIAEIAGDAGFDFVIVDLEHGAIGIETAIRMLMALSNSGTEAWVRIPEASEAWVKRALDAGAAALMVPRVESAESAARIAGWAGYGPEGRRGEGLVVARAGGYGRRAREYRTRWRASGQLVLQIESPEGLAAAPAIAAVPGVSMLFFGPSDYSASLGLAQDDPAILAAAAAIVAAARASGRDAGSVPFGPTDIAGLARLGFDHVARASEVPLLTRALDADLAAARQEVADAKG